MPAVPAKAFAWCPISKGDGMCHELNEGMLRSPGMPAPWVADIAVEGGDRGVSQLRLGLLTRVSLPDQGPIKPKGAMCSEPARGAIAVRGLAPIAWSVGGASGNRL